MTTALAFLGEQNEALPAFLAEAQDRGLGNENVNADDQQIPRLNLLQALSPQLEEIDAAKAGLFHNSVTNELYTDVAVINLFYKKEYTIWRKRKKGGGYCGAFENQDAANAHVESLPGSPEDYDIQDTAKHACLLLNQETGEIIQPIMIYLKGSGMTVSRNWNSQINSFNGDSPRFSSIWSITSIKKTKDQDTWFVMKVGDGAWVPNENLYNEAKAFYTTIKDSI
jgi:hypothetical protein